MYIHKQPQESSLLTIYYFVLKVTSGYGTKIDDVRIVGGGEANPNSIPWQVALVSSLSDGRRPFCGGTILCPNYVITAAHCTQWTRGIASRLHIIAGEHNLDVDMANDKATRPGFIFNT